MKKSKYLGMKSGNWECTHVGVARVQPKFKQGTGRKQTDDPGAQAYSCQHTIHQSWDLSAHPGRCHGFASRFLPDGQQTAGGSAGRDGTCRNDGSQRQK